jgi:hypothetical protein
MFANISNIYLRSAAQFKTSGIKNSDAAKQSSKKYATYCSDLKDGGHFEYFTSIPVF